jgi:gluconate 2-dehydrogenase gamma chain
LFERRLPRRKFLKGAAAAGCASLLAGCGGPPPAWRFFTADEAALVKAICDQIIPPDKDAGAAAADVPNFIDRQLAGTYRRHQQSYRKGLAGVQATSLDMFSSKFETLKWDDQTAVLQAIESGKVGPNWEAPSARTFFRLIRDHTMQGFYGSPRHGGNRDYASYRMLGIDYPQVVGQNRYRETSTRKS